MLAERYRNDGKPILQLNDLQSTLRDGVNEKVRAGVYGLESVQCAVCDSTDALLLSEKDRYGLACPVVICRRCGLIYTNPRMNRDAYVAFYENEYRPLYEGTKNFAEELFEQNMHRGRAIAAFLVSSGRRVDGLRVLEVGCGAGGALAHFRDAHGARVKGCDYGAEGVRFGVDHHGLDLEVGDLRSVALLWKPDLIIYSHVFEHILDLRGECRAIRSALSDEGDVYIEAPGVKNIRNAYDWDFLRLLQNAHTYHFTLATLSNVMRMNGFRCTAGNEFVRSLFAKGDPSHEYTSDVDSVLAFLRGTERLRWAGTIRASLGGTARWLLGRLGLKPLIKRMLGC